MLPSVLANRVRVALSHYVETTFPITNPLFKQSIKDLVNTPGGLLHDPYVAVHLPFRVADEEAVSFEAVRQEYKPYVHQQRAFDRLLGDDGRSTIVATGTGSGKTESFLYPILEYCYAHRSEPGVKALLIYPMNALASDQARRIAQLIYDNPELRGNVTAGMYVGGYEQHAPRTMTRERIITDRDTMLQSPPDILMTNYKMLDYLLVRPKDAALWQRNDPETLKFIVVDELHTFDGAQGTDLASLLRRLKARLSTPKNYLCCVGTSATIGTGDSSEKIRTYAEKVFGEPFKTDAVITEDRLSPEEFFGGHDVSDYTVPTHDDILSLAVAAEDEDQLNYLRLVATSWLDESFDSSQLATDEGRVALGEHLMGHDFTRCIIQAAGGGYVQIRTYIEEIASPHFERLTFEQVEAAFDALLALISHARTRDANGNLRPFLQVQVQLWFREWRRLLGKVSADRPTFALASDLNEKQMKQYLPVVNCRDCGETGWTSISDEQDSVALDDLRTFYNLFFKFDPKIRMLFPYIDDDETEHAKYRLCTNCLRLHHASRGDQCQCGHDTVPVVMPAVNHGGTGQFRQYTCPFCQSGGLAIIGLRGATATSAVLSPLYASNFNDDKKLLAFSDNVQDAAHRAGFFGARTWRFALRSAMQGFALDGGDDLPFDKFMEQLPTYWRTQMDKEKFVTTFIAPNMTWRGPFEQMKQQGQFPDDRQGRELLSFISRRMEYEALLEFGRRSRSGRTLEKSGCAVLYLDPQRLDSFLTRTHERLRNEFGELRDLSLATLERIVAGWIHQLRIDGAFMLPVFDTYIRNGAKPFHLSQKWIPWLPGVRSGINTPKFVAHNRMDGRFNVFTGNSWYAKWLGRHLHTDTSPEQFLVRPDFSDDVVAVIREELLHADILLENQGPKGMPVWGLAPDALRVSTRVVQMACDRCGHVVAVAEEGQSYWTSGQCVRRECIGQMHARKDHSLDYYGKLYSQGALVRIFPQEHTGLLDRDVRERVEEEFKASDGNRKPWYPNLLSSTPTLEMGIDIGDLSTVIMGNIPPGQSQYIQRIGRAGRKNGNALAVAIANARPHDLYFYNEPLEMIDGAIDPPDVFLDASAVLERQFVAYCMDCWVKSGIPVQAIPDTVGTCLARIKNSDHNTFPFNFLHYVQTNLRSLYRDFIAMFDNELSEASKSALKQFAQGESVQETPMHLRILNAFEDLYDDREALRKKVRRLRRMIQDLENKPEDSSFREEIESLDRERNALAAVAKAISGRNVFNFLSDEGLLPNYAFPEAGISLRALLYRRKRQDESEHTESRPVPYEYVRAASAAIREFAPANSFYAEGRQLKIDQIEMETTKSADWRLCPNCPHAELDETGRHTASCPRCGSPAWADAGQVRSMLKVRMVYANADYGESLIGDDAEDRRTAFYVQDMLVSVDEDHDVEAAYRIGTDSFPFGYEFVRNATMREINFGERDMIGERLTVAGREDVRKGFVVCSKCGRIQPENGPANHTMTCPARRAEANDPFEECLFLYREFETEALRILIPSTTMEPSGVWQESFVAAFMRGMREYFGNVDHLRSTISFVPIPESTDRKKYLVIYDSVPGGTGYLKQLMSSETAFIEILAAALRVLQQCNCKEDPDKDGCYRCLFVYRQSYNIGEISRRQAITILEQILAGKDQIEKISKLDDVEVGRLLESELERQLISAFSSIGTQQFIVEISKQIVNNKEGYILQVGECLWEIEPQVVLDDAQGVMKPSRPDFIFRPRRASQNQKPIAVFADGFAYHKDRIAHDTLQRAAIAQTGKYRVWTLTWKDVRNVIQKQGDYYAKTLTPENMPSPRMYEHFARGAEGLQPKNLSPFELFLAYLSDPDAEALFQTHARAYSLCLLSNRPTQDVFDQWPVIPEAVLSSLGKSDTALPVDEAMLGRWAPTNVQDYLTFWSGILTVELRDRQAQAKVVAIFNDQDEQRDTQFEKSWNGFWHFWNMMQFLPAFAGATSRGISNSIYDVLADAEPMHEPTAMPIDTWQSVLEQLFEPEAKLAARTMQQRGLPAPSTVGYELADTTGRVLGEAEMAWETEKNAWLLPAQVENRVPFETAGWTVYVGEETPPLPEMRREA